MMERCFCFMSILLPAMIFAQDSSLVLKSGTLSGVLPPLVQSSKYLVTGDIFVSPGSTVTIEAGTVFLFQEFTGLHVQGSLFVKGEQSAPVVFTSKNDSLYNDSTRVQPAPFDWNGIDVYESALGTTFSQCKINYSVFGIRSQCEYVKIENATFSNNGKSDFSIKNEQKTIVSQPYTYTHSLSTPTPVLSIHSVASIESEDRPMNKSLIEMESQKHSKRGGARFFRYTGLVLFLGGGAIAAFYGEKYMTSQKKLEDLSELSAEEKYRYTSEDWESAREKRNKNVINTAIGSGVGFLGLTSFILSFAF